MNRLPNWEAEVNKPRGGKELKDFLDRDSQRIIVTGGRDTAPGATEVAIAPTTTIRSHLVVELAARTGNRRRTAATAETTGYARSLRRASD